MFGFLLFNCCVYIFNIRVIDNFKEWVKCFLENFVFEKYVYSFDKIFCEVCLCESEEEDVIYFCFNCNEKMCKNCIKYYNRGLLICNY